VEREKSIQRKSEMGTSKSATTAEQSSAVEQNVEAEISNLVAKEILGSHFNENKDAGSHEEGTIPSEHENDLERLRSSIARLTSGSVDGLVHLTSELQKLEKLLKSEVERVKGEIDSALAGIKIITEAIAPWKDSTSAPLAPSAGSGSAREGMAKTDT
jgi:hypothetical protein